MGLGAVLGLWIASGSGSGFSTARAQMDGEGPPPAEPALPPPDQNLPPPDQALPPPDQALPPALPPPTGQMPTPEGNVVPPDLPPPSEGMDPGQSSGQNPQQIPPAGEDGVRLQVPQEFSYKTENPEGFIYNPEGLRDPFVPTRRGKVEVAPPTEVKQSNEIDFNPQDPLQAYTLAEYRLVGILWDVREPRAMVQTPEGRVYTIRRKIRLGREGAVVAAIRESEIVVVEPNPDGTYVNASTRVIPMRK